METLDRKIERYKTHFAEQIELVSSIESKASYGLHHKLLYCSILDAFSKAVYPRKPNRDRFVRFVSHFCDWPNSDRVSLSHLYQALLLHPEPEFEALRLDCRNRLNRLSSGSPNLLGIDPTFEEIKNLWPKGNNNEKVGSGITLEALKHVSLLWQHRNQMVHEYRSSGWHIHEETDEPHYYEMTEIVSLNGTPINYLELVYPPGFFKSLCVAGLTNLIEYLVRNELNPFTSYRFGPYWLSELNESAP